MAEQVISTPELEIRILANGIHIYKLAGWLDEGLAQWEQSVVERLDKADKPVLSIYDMRGMTTVSRAGFAVVSRIFAHPKVNYAYSAAVLNNRRVALLVNSLIQMRRGGDHHLISSNIDDAIDWLSTKI